MPLEKEKARINKVQGRWEQRGEGEMTRKELTPVITQEYIEILNDENGDSDFVLFHQAVPEIVRLKIELASYKIQAGYEIKEEDIPHL